MESIRTLLVERESSPLQATLAAAREFAVEHRRTLRSALRRLRGGNVDVVVLDLDLPDSSGVTAVVRLHEVAPDVPIVVVTDVDDEALAVRALRARAEEFLPKGRADGTVLQSTIRRALERRRVHVRSLEEATAGMRSLNAHLERLASIDPLTELLNRRGLEAELSVEVRRKRHTGAPLAAVLLDCDDFKQINETLGYAGGDVVLRELAARMQETLRPSDHIGRVGGDEFLVLLPDTRFAEALQVAERLRLSVSDHPMRLPAEHVHVTASLGIELVSDETLSIDEVLGQTQTSLQNSKRGGKNRVSTLEQAAATSGVHSEDLLRSLQGEGALQIVRHPILRLTDEAVVGWELMPRAPAGAFQLPRDFFRLALERNMLPQVDLLCLRACTREARELPVSSACHVNVFPSTLIEIPAARLVELFAEQGHAVRFCVELGEPYFVGDPALLLDQVRALKEAGVQVAIDDVGFGRSSLETLILLEPDVVKLDAHFVQRTLRQRGKEASLQRMVDVVASLGSELVADGIESRKDLERLLDLGVSYGQGPRWEPSSWTAKATVLRPLPPARSSERSILYMRRSRSVQRGAQSGS